MSKAKMQAAKELIQAKQYKEARSILKTIDHPMAREWEAKIDRMSPVKASDNRKVIYIGLSIVIVLLIAIVALLIINRPQSPAVVASNLNQVPAANATRDCGAYDWWNLNATEVMDFMGSAGALVRFTPDQASFEVFLDAMREHKDNFDKVNVPLCAKEAHDTIINGMYDYIFGFSEIQLNSFGTDISEETPEEFLLRGQESFNRASAMITELTGMDASFMFIDIDE